MTAPISLQPATADPSARRAAGAARRSGLPVDLLEDVARRLQIVAVLVLCLAPVNAVMNRVTGTSLNSLLRFGGAGLAVAVSLVVLLAARRGRLSPGRLLDMGLAYGVVVAALIALATVPANWFAAPRPPLLWSPVSVWVVLFPVLVPNTTTRALIAATLAAGSEFLVVAVYAALGAGALPPAGVVVRVVWTSVLAVIMAVVFSRVIYRLGEKLSAARALGSYQLEKKLGEGGMGEVWLARHRLLARAAAVKVIHPEQLGVANDAEADRVFQRFEREAQATAALQSPHTITVFDYGIARDGTFYYVMELLDGIDLFTLVAEHGPQPPERVVHLLRQACHSLYEAHERGLIHRDIKPANLFICRYGLDVDFVKLLDFGLVKPLETPGAADLRLTHADALTGTPTYMAPEAILTPERMDGRADLYALGCVAYFLLSGQDVFQGSSIPALLVAHAQQPPTPLAQRAPHRVPPELDALVLACLAKDPNQRPRTAEELSLRLAGLGLEERWTPERARAWWAAQAMEANGPHPR